MNQTPEQLARDHIDEQLVACGWVVQPKKQFNLAAGLGVAVREYQTDVGPADYVLFVDRKPVGIIEAKREDEGVRLITVEEQSVDYAHSKLKHLDNAPLPTYKSKLDFQKMINNLNFRPIVEFGPEELEERQRLLFDMIKIIWD